VTEELKTCSECPLHASFHEKAEKNEDRAIGIRIVRRALEEPLQQIANNAGEVGSRDVQRGHQCSTRNSSESLREKQ
jgi:chaperonin GroEL (HSP60 family)